MSSLETINAGSPGVEYFFECLDGERGVARAVVSLIASKPIVEAIVPEGTDIERIEKFDSGGLVVNPFFSFNKWLKTRLSEQKFRNISIILQDFWITPEDIKVASEHREISNVFLLDDSVYFYLSIEELERDRLLNIIDNVMSFNFALYVTSLDIKKLSSITISLFTSSVREVYLSAYDRESFLLWRR